MKGFKIIRLMNLSMSSNIISVWNKLQEFCDRILRRFSHLNFNNIYHLLGNFSYLRPEMKQIKDRQGTVALKTIRILFSTLFGHRSLALLNTPFACRGQYFLIPSVELLFFFSLCSKRISDWRHTFGNFIFIVMDTMVKWKWGDE